MNYLNKKFIQKKENNKEQIELFPCLEWNTSPLITSFQQKFMEPTESSRIFTQYHSLLREPEPIPFKSISKQSIRRKESNRLQYNLLPNLEWQLCPLWQRLSSSRRNSYYQKDFITEPNHVLTKHNGILLKQVESNLIRDVKSNLFKDISETSYFYYNQAKKIAEIYIRSGIQILRLWLEYIIIRYSKILNPEIKLNKSLYSNIEIFLFEIKPYLTTENIDTLRNSMHYIRDIGNEACHVKNWHEEEFNRYIFSSLLNECDKIMTIIFNHLSYSPNKSKTILLNY
ncbi:hypothetical protein DB313_03870 [Borrelia turcica IST7]|uniref:DUF4145 domain-containing protein n=1 Tax=Borrelia turcica IST7 TaxID=1104446 RepID=A0A386PMS6_9SPIR|nr:DUF4145 domain-containing protein [Borrelia turcica]AYE36588.1 hypothetical protein DB313_03870 [Borrelia turcica IST7]